MKKTILAGALSIVALFGSGGVSAAPFIINTTLDNIGTGFDSVVNNTGSSIVTQGVTSGQNVYQYTDINGNAATVTVTRPDGSSFAPSGGYSSKGISLSGATWNINPRASSSDPIPGYNSGLTFTFSSPINAFGFEIGDWATCCRSGTRPDDIVSAYGVPTTGSGLWIAFDGGAATLPANALSASDNPGYVATGSYTNFIGAIDSSGYFSSITFFGDGFGERLVAGGTLRFASVPQGSVGAGGNVSVPEPAVLALFGLGLAGLGAIRRRKP
ncbi:MAG: PEP-CTERM sorting domain-containing protein [Azoarcus sp.]|jgi:hypothetical protein|nr:PEP-CTERM sorting domain-containing protein [Azoarcus sp.]